MTIDLVVTDLDGTLWNDNRVAAESTKDALGELAARGIPVLAATARAPRSVKHVAAGNGLDLPVAVVLNGALGIDYRTGASFHSRTFTTDVARTIVDCYLRAGIEPCIYVNGDDYIVKSANASSAFAYLDSVREDLTHVDNLARYAKNVDAFGIHVLGTHNRGALDTIANQLAQIAEMRITEDRQWGGWALFASPFNITKWGGVLAYCKKYGHSPDNILAIGDAENDVELIRNASIGCAMAHAPASVRNEAHTVIDEWAQILDLL